MDKALEFLIDYIKHLSTLAGIFLAFSIAFFREFATVSPFLPFALAVAWISWILSIFCAARAFRRAVSLQIDAEEDRHVGRRSADPISGEEGPVARATVSDQTLVRFVGAQAASFLTGLVVLFGSLLVGVLVA